MGFPILKIGYARTLTNNDLYTLTEEMKVDYYIKKYEENLANEVKTAKENHVKNKRKGRNESLTSSSILEEEDLKDFAMTKFNLLFVILRTFKGNLIKATLYCVFAFLGFASTPLVSKELTNYVEYKSMGSNIHIGKGLGYAVTVTLILLITGFFFTHGEFQGLNVGINVKAVLTDAILKKSFKLNAESRHRFQPGKITSIMTTDLSRIQLACLYQPLLISLPVPLVFVIVILILNIGVSAVIGIVMFFMFLGGVSYSTSQLYNLREQASKMTDMRVGLVKEMINHIKVIKYYCWEIPYFSNIYNARTKEVTIIMKIQTIRNVINALTNCISGIIAMVAFLILYALEHATKGPGAMFSSVSSFAILSEVVYFIPLCLSTGADMMIGFDRLAQYLFAPEIEDADIYLGQLDKKSLHAIEVESGYFRWESFETNDNEVPETSDKANDTSVKQVEKNTMDNNYSYQKPTPTENIFSGLIDINLSIMKGEFVVITGSIGSGKSSLLNAIAGFMKREMGSVKVNGSMVLCGAPWVQNATVRNNIIFGKEFQLSFYDEVIYACSLQNDLDALEAGDFAEVGEKGVTLSGGQKARINLARAVYANKDVILLDDVLSAVDARVGKHIIDHCFLRLLKDKTRILATHQLSLIDSADRIIHLNGDGSIDVGTVNELLSRNAGFSTLMAFSKSESNTFENEATLSQEGETQKNSHNTETSELIASYSNSLEPDDQIITRRNVKSKEVVDDEVNYKDIHKNKDVAKGKIVEDEDRAVNAIKGEVYLQYIQAGVGRLHILGFIIIMTILLTLSTFCGIFGNTWLSFWVSKKFPSKSNTFYIAIYVALNLMWVCLVTIEFIVLVTMTATASKNLNLESIKNVMYATMSFMDVNPTGRMLNRFTKDTDALDNEISEQLRAFTFTIAQMIGVLVLMFVYLPWAAVSIPFLGIIFISVANYYQASSREVKRLEALKRTFVYTNFDEALSGIATIKSHNCEQNLIDNNKRLTNEMTEASVLYNALQRWLSMQLEFISSMIVLIVSLLCVFKVFHISAASVGLVLSYSTQLSGLLMVVMRAFTQLENDMNSVERVCHYANQIPQEIMASPDNYQIESSWPSAGEIEFSNVSLAYRPGLPLILNNLNFYIRGKEKIGICGRTGAGKSSIVTALYRLSELNGGKIEIDGVDTSNIGLRDLRSHLSIIPQDPVLFSNSIRRNLDPFGEHDDERLCDALRRSGCIDKDVLNAIKLQQKTEDDLHKFHLDQFVEDGGKNFSLGERQLIALARALVRDTRILILDEATSLVDYETDSKVQETIVTEFAHCTILCIAHRLKTILNYDRIMTLDKGEIKELDTPLNLFNSNGIFRQMCDKSKIHIEDFVSQSDSEA